MVGAMRFGSRSRANIAAMVNHMMGQAHRRSRSASNFAATAKTTMPTASPFTWLVRKYALDPRSLIATNALALYSTASPKADNTALISVSARASDPMRQRSRIALDATTAALDGARGTGLVAKPSIMIAE